MTHGQRKAASRELAAIDAGADNEPGLHSCGGRLAMGRLRGVPLPVRSGQRSFAGVCQQRFGTCRGTCNHVESLLCSQIRMGPRHLSGSSTLGAQFKRMGRHCFRP